MTYARCRRSPGGNGEPRRSTWRLARASIRAEAPATTHLCVSSDGNAVRIIGGQRHDAAAMCTPVGRTHGMSNDDREDLKRRDFLRKAAMTTAAAAWAAPVIQSVAATPAFAQSQGTPPPPTDEPCGHSTGLNGGCMGACASVCGGNQCGGQGNRNQAAGPCTVYCAPGTRATTIPAPTRVCASRGTSSAAPISRASPPTPARCRAAPRRPSAPLQSQARRSARRAARSRGVPPRSSKASDSCATRVSSTTPRCWYR